jgi:hypothetical protein
VAAPSNFASLAITAAGGVTLGDGVAHGGTGGSSTATLALDNVHISSTSTIGLQVISTAADAARFRSTGGNGDGLEITGNGSGNGIRAVGGSTGHGAAFVGGGTSGSGVSASATTDGDGIILAGASNGHGMRSTGAGSGTGIFAAMTGNITGTITTATNVTTVNGLAAGVITATSIATGAIDADAIAADAVTEIQSGLSTLTQAQVQTECEEALQTYHLDHLIASADPGGVVANSSFWAKLHSKSATPAFSSYDNTTDSLEALRDNVGTAGAGLTAADDAVITAIAALNNLSAAQVNAEVLDVLTVDTLIDGKTFVQATQYVSAITAGRVSGAGTGTEVFKGLDESTTRVTVTVDGSGNRTDITYG